MKKLESMSAFFEARLNGYDEYMLNEVEGCREGYKLMAKLVPANAAALLDLGCGTGLELDALFALHPDIGVTAIDLTKAMLDRLAEKHPHRRLELICGDYFKTDFGKDRFDCAVSFETLHHFGREKKQGLYNRIHESLREGGCYIECDYTVETQAEEEFFFSEFARIKKAQGLDNNEFYHYDTPQTAENLIQMFITAGFKSAEKLLKIGGTTVILCKK